MTGFSGFRSHAAVVAVRLSGKGGGDCVDLLTSVSQRKLTHKVAGDD